MIETKNKFQKHHETRAANRVALNRLNRAEAAAKQAKNREAWTQPTRQTFGLLLDSKTLAAKAAALADRNKEIGTALTVMSEKSIEAIVQRWAQETNFYSSDFNNLSLKNRLREQVDDGQPFSYELLNETADWLRRNNHLEQAPKTVRKRGEIVSSAVPTLYEYIPADEQAAIDAELAAKEVENRAKEDAVNKSLPLDELRRRVAAGRGVISRDSIRLFQG